MSDSRITRRALLNALTGGGFGLALGGCIVPSRPPPRVDHVGYPIGAIRRLHATKGLYVGASSVDITPPEGSRVWIAGFGFQRRMHQIRDPIFARCFYVDDGENEIALIAADVVGLMRPSVERIRRLVGNGIQVAVVATHNHQSPDTMGYWGKAILFTVPYASGIDPAYLRVFERRLALSVKLAAESARSAKLSFARGKLPPGIVRNLRNPGVYDDAVEVMEARTRGSEKTIATFVNFGCHAETIGDAAHVLTADFPSPLRDRVEEKRGGTAIFANGILGGMITPDIDKQTAYREKVAFMQKVGVEVADVAVQAIRDAKPVDVRNVSYQRSLIELPSTNALFGYVERVGLIEPRMAAGNNAFSTEVGRIDFGPAKWALVPGEPTPKVGLRIKESLGAEHPVVLSLANDELGYILDPSEFDDPNFEYEASMSVGRDTAPIVEKALASLG